MNDIGTFEGIALALIAGGLIYLFARNAKSAMENAPKAEAGDWMSAIIPLAAVVGFVMILIMLAKN